MALERRIPLELLRELENQMFGSDLVKKLAFVQNRVDLEVTRLVHQGPSMSAVNQRAPNAGRAVTAMPASAGFFDNDDDDEDGPASRDSGYEDELFSLSEQLRAIQLKIGKGKGGGRGQQRPKAGGGGAGGGRREGGKAEGRGGGRGGKSGEPSRSRVPPELMQKNFETGCFYCGSQDHPRFKCPKLTAVLKERGLRKVDGKWVDPALANPGGGSADGSQSGEDWYCSLLDGSDGSDLGAVFSPPPVPTGAVRRPPRARQPAATQFGPAACSCMARTPACAAPAGLPTQRSGTPSRTPLRTLRTRSSRSCTVLRRWRLPPLSGTTASPGLHSVCPRSCGKPTRQLGIRVRFLRNLPPP